jgi:hypothetical protein
LNINFYKLLLGNIFSRIGSSLFTLVIITVIYKTTESATLSSIVALVRTSALILSGLQIKFFTERIVIYKLIGYLYLFQAIIIFFILLQFKFITTGISSIILIYFFTFLIAYADGLINPCRNSLLPFLVQESDLLKANSILSSAEQVIGLGSWLIGGILVSVFHHEILIVGVILIYLCAFPVFINLKIHNEQLLPMVKSKRIFQFDGLDIIKSNPFLTRMLIIDIIEGIGTGIWIGGITLAFVKVVLHQNETWWGYINAGYYIGTLIGGSLLITLSSYLKKRIHVGMSIGSLGVSVSLLLYGFNNIPIIALILVICAGVFYQFRDSTQRTLLQLNVKKTELSTFYGVYGAIYNIIFGLSVFLMGTIADVLYPSYIYIIGSLLSFTTSILIVKTLKFDMSKINNEEELQKD